jgi:hypothetical protein
MKETKTFRISKPALALLDELVKVRQTTQASLIDEAIRLLAKKEGVKLPPPK